MKLTIPLCDILARTAEAKAEEIGVPMVIAVADDRGELIYFTRMADALPASIQIAISKAYTSAALRMDTEKAGKLAQPGQMLYGIQNSMERSIVIFGGGKPLCIKGETVGAVGISGGSVDEDILVAETVVKLFEKMGTLIEPLRPMIPEGIRWTSELGHQLSRSLENHLTGIDGDDINALVGGILLF